MKNIMAAIVVLMVFVVSVFAQGYRSNPGAPTQTELRKIKGITDYIQDGVRENFTLYLPGEAEQYTLQETNNVVVFRSDSQLTNVVVVLPNVTNYPRARFKLVANGNLTIKLTNTVGVTYNTATNVTALSTWTSATNSSFYIYNNQRTNWFISPN